MLHWFRRFIRLLAYTLSGLGALLLILWAIRGARPALDCGLSDYLAAADWAAAYACTEQADFDPLVGVVTLAAGALLGLAAWLSRERSEQSPSAEESVGKRERNRREMMRRMREIWIDGALKRSLHQEVLIDLHMEQRAGATPWGMAARIGAGGERPVPAGTSIVKLFDEAHASLVILGAPGSGKSTALLELAQALLDRCEADPIAPVPVVFNLSTQQREYGSLEAWVAAELTRFYAVPKEVAAAWAQGGELALLFDGLDEVPSDKRDAVVGQINEFLGRRMDVSLAVCCREAEYVALTQGVKTSGVVRLLPLDDKQIDSYLERLDGEPPRQMRALLDEDAALRELAESPLLLNIMLRAADELRPAAAGAGDARTRVYDAYLRAMLKRDRTQGLAQANVDGRHDSRRANGKPVTYAGRDTVRWLRWLAGKMNAQGSTVFLLERMNKAWFNRRYEWLVWPLGIGLVSGLVYGLVGGPVYGLVGRLGFALAGGLFGGLVVGLNDISIQESVSIRLNHRSIVGGLGFALVFMLASGLVGGLVFVLVVGLFDWLVVGLVFRLADWLADWLVVWLVIGLVIGLVFRLVSTSTELETNYQVKTPNAGTSRSLRNGLIAGLVGGLVIGLVVGLVYGLIFELVGGLVGGLTFGLIYGLDDFLKHYLLRLVLRLDGSLPLRYVRFLDYCDDRVLLRRVGGGYMFIHRTFQEYMAAVDIDRLGL